MFRNRLYYRVKPMLPRNLRLAIRRQFALRKRRHISHLWPILPGSERKPEGWSGWPDGKQFAVILTHDVEGVEGFMKCLALAKIEQDLGFRSSFNFIPEGRYNVTKEIREQLVSQGFEVGVHDLKHDGRLFQDRDLFRRRAQRINHYLDDWGAVGFRSGFMLHKLDWLHDLNIQYDASTFDTDPFEPQPEGRNTVFPFWVPSVAERSDIRGSSIPASQRSTQSGYVELPYTLPQDSTLFLLLRESTSGIWLRKLDWVAQHGGMALVNVHPDYVRMPGEPSTGSQTYPVEFYIELLHHIKTRYARGYWNALPRNAAAHFASAVGASSQSSGRSHADGDLQGHRCALNGKRAAIVLYSGYPSDPRPRRELESLVERGMSVDLICLADDADQPKQENIGSLTVTRTPIQHKRSGKIRYFWDYARFFLHAFRLLTVRSLSRRYDLVHVHNMPDFLAFSALIPKWAGARLILDLHDPMPELYQTIYRLKMDSIMVRMLKSIEKASIGFADLVLTPNEAFRQLFCSRSCREGKVRIVMNTPDESLFRHDTKPSTNAEAIAQPGEYRLMYHGLIAERHGLSTAIHAVHRANRTVDKLVLEIFGKPNAYLEQVTQLASQLGLNGQFRYRGRRRIDDIPAAILESDLGVIPNCRTPFTEINFPTRIFEYLCLGKPVIVPRTRGIQDYFSEDSIIFFEPDNADDLSEKICWAHAHPEEVQAIVARGRAVYEQHRWAVEKHVFLGLVENLLTGRAAPAERSRQTHADLTSSDARPHA